MTEQKKAAVIGVKEVFNLRTFLGNDNVPDMRLSLYKFEAEKHEGGTQVTSRVIFDRGDAVGVLGYDPKRDEVVLINEMRGGILAAGGYPYTDNVVAGGLKPNEDAVAAAVREWSEETAGTDVLKDPVLIHKGAYVSSGGTSEKIAIVFGIIDTSKAGGVAGLAEEHEDIRTIVLPAKEFIRRIGTPDEITDLKTLVAGYWFTVHRDELRLKYAPEVAVKPKVPSPALAGEG